MIQTRITCNKNFCYMRDSACWWLLVENTKIFRSYLHEGSKPKLVPAFCSHLLDFFERTIAITVTKLLKILREIWVRFFHKTIINLISTNLITKLLISLFCPLVETKIRIKFSASWWSGNENISVFLLIANRALLQSHAELSRLLKKKFSYMLFLLVL